MPATNAGWLLAGWVAANAVLVVAWAWRRRMTP